MNFKRKLLLSALGASLMLLSSCVVPVDYYGGPACVGSSIPVAYTGPYYYYGGLYYIGGRYDSGRYYYRGRYYDGRYCYKGRYYYGGRYDHCHTSNRYYNRRW